MRKVLWEWNVRAHSFVDQIKAATAGEFDALTLPYRKYVAEHAAGRPAEMLATMARDEGVTLDFLDGVSGWAPIRYPSAADEFLRKALDFGPDEVFSLCEGACLRHIVAIAGFEHADLPHSQLVECFGTFWSRAAAEGIWVDLEAMPMLGLPRLADAWAIVREANQPNSGVLLDTWHFMRGGADFELLGSIDRGKIVNIQVVDGLAAAPSAGLWEDANHHREFPGRGELPLTRILELLHATQNLESAGPEALSDRVDRLSAAENGREAAATLNAVLNAAGFNL